MHPSQGGRFRDRRAAGELLGAALHHLAGRSDVLVLALPRGGVPAGYEVARALDARLDVFVVRKLGVPGRAELAMGALASGGVRVHNREVIDALGIDDATLAAVVAREQAELERRELLYRGERRQLAIGGQLVVVVDDGLATGSTMRAAVAAVRAQAPRQVIVAAPVGSAEAARMLQHEADGVLCLALPEPFHAVGLWYQDFRQTTDAEVHQLLAAASGRTN